MDSIHVFIHDSPLIDTFSLNLNTPSESISQHKILQGDNVSNIQNCIYELKLICHIYSCGNHRINSIPQKQEDITKVPRTSPQVPHSPPFKTNCPEVQTQMPEFFQCPFLLAHIVLSESTNHSHFLPTLSLLSDLLNTTVVQLNRHLFLFLFTLGLHLSSQLFFLISTAFPKCLILIKNKTQTLFST